MVFNLFVQYSQRFVVATQIRKPGGHATASLALPLKEPVARGQGSGVRGGLWKRRADFVAVAVLSACLC